MKILKYALIALFSIAVMSCGGGGGGGDDDVDTVAPTVTINQPTATTEVTAGNNITVNFLASDNVALSSYTLTVTFAGVKTTKTVQEFSFNSASDLDASNNPLPTISGTSKTVSFNIATTDNATPGPYKLAVVVKDSAGKSTAKDVTFQIK